MSPGDENTGFHVDMRAPLTPDIAVQVLPVPFAADLTKTSIRSQPTKASLARIGSFLAVPSNSSFLGKHLLTKFIKENFGKSAPKIIGYRIVNGRLETIYEAKPRSFTEFREWQV